MTGSKSHKIQYEENILQVLANNFLQKLVIGPIKVNKKYLCSMGTEDILVTEFRRHTSPGYNELYKKKMSRAT